MDKVKSLSDIAISDIASETVSFDLFDTLIYRKYLSVFQVHDLASAYALTQVGRYQTDSIADLTQRRYAATDMLKLGEGDPVEEPPLANVWAEVMSTYLPEKDAAIAMGARIAAFEFDVDFRNLSAVDGARALLERLKEAGKKIIAISDMYFSTGEIRQVLANVGLLDLFDDVYVSATVNKTKQTGSLFTHVCQEHGLQSAELTHFGDNTASDVANPRKLGITGIHVDHHESLKLHPPEYGHNADVHQDIAALIKLFVAQTVFHTKDNDRNTLFFLSRDGYLIHQVLQTWKNPLLHQYFPQIDSADLFISRAISCWLNVNFNTDWLVQSIGHAFWLLQGKATPKQISALLGIEVVPSSLTDREYSSDKDTFIVQEAYVAAGLTQEIRRSILDKRSRALRHFRECGLLDNDGATICDVGYSGTVVRDLNTFFLQEGLGDVPPIGFNCISSNANYALNSISALPHIDFCKDVILSADTLPKSLTDSYAWLEMFFKHPTFGPLLGYCERDGQMQPDYQVATEVPPNHPAPRILAASHDTPSDIVLLWMAAVREWSSFTDVLINRFTNPDMNTIREMAADIYEVDAVTGQTRSVLLIDPSLDDAQLYVRAKAGDYWIPGSIIATNARRSHDRKNRNIGKSIGQFIVRRTKDARHAIRNIQENISKKTASPLASFDPVFYRDFYPDLRKLPDDEALKTHYLEHGRLVGRYGCEAEMRAALAEARTRYLTPDENLKWKNARLFLERGYVQSDEDNASPLTVDQIQKCRNEFEELAFQDRLAFTTAETEQWQKGHSACDIFLARYDLLPAKWLDVLNLVEFNALNHKWAGYCKSLAQAVIVFAQKGVTRLAPLSLNSIFDADFYRQRHPRLAQASDESAYRHWLTHGYADDEPTSESEMLQALIGQRSFPSAFDADLFRKQNPVLAGTKTTRGDILAAFLTSDKASHEGVISGDGSGSLWRLHADFALQRGNDELAQESLYRALENGAPAGSVWHKLGDMERQRGRLQAAMAAYLKGIASPYPDRWNYINGMQVAAQLGAFQTGLKFLEEGEKIWKRMQPWRMARENLFRLWFDSEAATSLAMWNPDYPPVGQPETKFSHFLDKFIPIMARSVPSGLKLCRPDGPILMRVQTNVSERVKWELELRNADDTIRKVIVFPRHHVQLLTESLPGASLLILHEVELDSLVIDTVLFARGYGIPTLSWTGSLGVLPSAQLDLSELAWSDFVRKHEGFRKSITLREVYSGRLCDSCVSTAPAFVPALADVVPDGHVVAGVSAATNAIRKLPSAPGDTVRILVYARGRPIPRQLRHGRQANLSPEQLRAIDDLTRALVQVLKNHDQVELIIDGNLPAENEFRSFDSRVTVINARMQPDEALALTAAVDLVVDFSGSREYYRSHWAEAAWFGIPAIVSNERLHSRLTDGANVLVVPNAPALPAAVDRILQDRTLATQVGNAARLDLKSMLVSDEQAVAAVKAPIVPSAVNRKRILYANVFAPPQIIGGATRVLTDNMQYMLDHAHDRYDLAVLASDDENSYCSMVRCDAWKGIPVFQIATPQEIDMDWRMYNSDVDAYTRRVLKLMSPDLVHIHCLQRLSIAVAEACLALRIPYVITLHDAWWLSDFSFLTEEDGSSASLSPDPSRQTFSRRIGLPRSLERAMRCRHVLHGAEALLSVSEPFAKLFRDAGFKVETIANGVSSFQPEKTKQPHTRVQLGHVGGTQAHKGVYMIESVLRTNRFKNLDLTVIELARDTGDSIQTVWGTTPVTITGKIPADRIGALYDRLDVLLAPSTWPESFGLVSREAASHGLWVIAGDRGAMGENVENGQNGFVIDVSNTEELEQVLRKIDANPEQYLEPPKVLPTLRSANDQGRDLLEFYGRLLKTIDGAGQSKDSRNSYSLT
ncbi:glycosyltransferase [Komagataeibacter sp. FNDCF1]|uniref:glycosyltransferase n=1 Tax=Komagataeibacter sp. FNDCF1 TaxID=2878681 RepID=UPI001E4ABD99|nr:glycosyltransferase [Komagataeibacter sp. FNDCF1]MCE2565400.1 glycosyltransferase [Komagataeibacter sp. FNDCF1]